MSAPLPPPPPPCDAAVADPRQAEFDALVAGLPDFLQEAVTKLWAKPPVAAMQQALGPGVIEDVSSARRVLFFARGCEDGALYARLVQDSKKKDANKARRPCLAMLFALHCGNVDLLRGFGAHGGFEPLAACLTDSDLHVRAHAVEIFKAVTADDDLWYSAPEDDPIDTVPLKAHEHMLGLATGDESTFLEGLVANRADSYPGGEVNCLQVLAWYLGWCRQMHADARKLECSRWLLAHLAEWAGLAKERGDDVETQLAVRLCDDFTRMGVHDGLGHLGNVALRLADVDKADLEADDDGAFDLSDTTGPTPRQEPATTKLPAWKQAGYVAPSPKKLEKDAKQRGNEAFARGEFGAALAAYDEALAGKEGTSDKNRAAVAVLRCNKATCLLKVHEADPCSTHLDACEVEVRAALEADSSNAKAHYRLAQSLARRGESRLDEAILAATAARDHAATTQNAAVEDLLVELLERLSHRDDQQNSSHQKNQAKKTSKTARTLAKLLARPTGNHELLGGNTGGNTGGTKTTAGTAAASAASSTATSDEAPSAETADQGAAPEAALTLHESASRRAEMDDGPDSDDDDAIAAKPRPKQKKPPKKQAAAALETADAKAKKRVAKILARSLAS